MQQNPILVERYRGNVLESFHRGVICIVDEKGEVVFSVGDIEQICFPRSALKLFQILPLLESGAVEKFGFTMDEIAIMCGSHNGEKSHIAVVEKILQKIGLSKTKLKCGAQYPTLTEDRNELIKADKNPEDLHNNCSGKHAGFLAMCVFMGWDPETYHLPEHPLQQAILQITAQMHEYDVYKITTALDGCSAPIFSLPVYNQAIGYKNLMSAEKFGEERAKSCKTVIEALTKYPHLIAGTKRYCTEMMEVCGSRIFGKTGADGVYSLGFINEKLACTIKIDDGLMGPQYSVAQRIIEDSGIFDKKILKPLHHYIESPIVNWAKNPTGESKVNEEIFSQINLSVN
ncbi:MAG: asparaginase [Bacteroidia bacterium]